MEFSILIIDRNTTYNISKSVTSMTLESFIEGQAGKCTLTCDKTQITANMGSMIEVKVGNIGMFKGYLFNESFSNGFETELTFYDQLRYWKYSDAISMSGLKLHEVFYKLCKIMGLNYKAYNTTRYVLPAKIWSNATYFKIWEDYQDLNFISTNGYHIIRDEFGVLALHEVQYLFNNTVKKYIISDTSLAKDYEFSRGIGSDTYNIVKIVNENSETKKRETHTAQDNNTIKQWGRLQYFEKSSEELNSAQLKKRAEDLLKVKSRVFNSLDVELIGNADTLNLRVGDGVIMGISDLTYVNLYGKALVIEKIAHKFNGGRYTVDLTLMLS